MAEEPEPAGEALAGLTIDLNTSGPEMSLTDLMDEIERASFQRALDSRYGSETSSGESESTGT